MTITNTKTESSRFISSAQFQKEVRQIEYHSRDREKSENNFYEPLIVFFARHEQILLLTTLFLLTTDRRRV